MADAKVQNVADKASAGFVLTEAQAASFKKYQESQVKMERYTAKQTLILRKAKEAKIDATEAEIDAYLASKKAKAGTE